LHFYFFIQKFSYIFALPKHNEVQRLKIKIMANQITKISKKVTEWVELSGYDIEKVKKNMKHFSFAVEKLSVKEAKEEGCDMNYPYRLFNPYNLSVK
jgi:hypothetical protein